MSQLSLLKVSPAIFVGQLFIPMVFNEGDRRPSQGGDVAGGANKEKDMWGRTPSQGVLFFEVRALIID